ncbi:hypothetical protein BGZ94_005899 [Podila epigama]|nr:hypothetical protein BGZ94_005899 [Podila epigama]
MGASLIATKINIDTLVGALLVGASIVLTLHSLSRMIFMKRSGSKYHLFPIINVAQFLNQWCVFILITTAFGTISHRTALWLNVANNISYFITKPTTLYLAFLRCSAVYPPFSRFLWIHYFIIGFRAIELFVIIFVNIVQNELCGGSVDKGTRCESLAYAWTFRDAGAPFFRGYYILCEAIFYYKLFTTLKGMSKGKNLELIQYRRLQTSLFTVDLIFLIFMSIYRIIGIFKTDLPTYVYYELFSSTLTIFTLTEFGLNIRMLFNSVAVEPRTNSGIAGDHRGHEGGPGSALSSSPDFTTKLEMGEISHKSRPLTDSSQAPLTRHHNNSDDLDVSSFMHRDYAPYPVHTSPTTARATSPSPKEVLSDVSAPRQQYLKSEWLHSPIVRNSADHHPLNNGGGSPTSPSHQYGVNVNATSNTLNEKSDQPRYGGALPRQYSGTVSPFPTPGPLSPSSQDSPAVPDRAASRVPRSSRRDY